MYKKLRLELPGKVLPSLPKKNKQSSTASNLMSSITGKDDDDASSISSVSTMGTMQTDGAASTRNLLPRDHRRSASASTLGRASPRPSMDGDRSATPTTDEVCSYVK